MRPLLEVAALSGIAAVGAATLTWMLVRARRNPAERERKRRVLISLRGRLIEGMVSDFSQGVVYYSYSWQGVDYEASQDLSTFQHDLPTLPDLLVGPVTVRFLGNDPSNSIVLSESWCGFPRVRRMVVEPQAGGQ